MRLTLKINESNVTLRKPQDLTEVKVSVNHANL
jgi:hypothetical protein